MRRGLKDVGVERHGGSLLDSSIFPDEEGTESERDGRRGGAMTDSSIFPDEEGTESNALPNAAARTAAYSSIFPDEEGTESQRPPPAACRRPEQQHLPR